MTISGTNAGPAYVDTVARLKRGGTDGVERKFGGFFGRLKDGASTTGLAIGSALAAGVTAGAGLIAKGVSDAINREQITDQLAARLGAFGPEADRLARVTGSIYASGFGDSLEDVTAGIAATSENLSGLVPDDALEASTTRVLDLAKALDEDVSTVARSAGQLLRNGLAANAEEAFDILAAGQANGLNRSQDLLDTINEYSPAFARLGIDGQAALGLIDQGLDAGAFNADKIGDAFNEFSIRAIDGSEASSGALRTLGLDADATAQAIAGGGEAARLATADVIDRLGAIDDKVQRDAAGVALFGSIWEDLGADVILSLDPIEGSLDNVEGASGRLSDTLNDNLGTRIESLKRRGLGALANFAEKNVVPKLEQLFDFIELHGPAAIEYFQTRVRPVLEDIGRRIGDFVALAVGLFRDNWPQIQETVGEVIATISTVVTEFVDTVSALWERWGEDILRFVENAWGPIKQIIEGVLRQIRGVIQIITGLISGDWSKVWEGIKNVVGGAIEEAKGKVKLALEALRLAVSIALDVLKTTFATPFNAIRDGIQTAFREAKDFVEERIDDIVTFFTDLPGRLAGLGSGMFDFIKNAFKSSVNFIIDGWNSLEFKIPGFDPPGPGPKFGGFTLGLPDVPRLAEGGDVSRAGLSIVGEDGPELLKLDRGASVVPLDVAAMIADAEAHANSGGDGIEQNFYGPQDPAAIASATTFAIRSTGR